MPTTEPTAPITHPIPAGWVSTGQTGAQNYDEFADDAEITAIVAANPASMLAVEMPHRTPEAVAAGWDFPTALPSAAGRLDALRADRRLEPFADAVAVYQIGEKSRGVFCLVDTDQISTSADEPGLVIRNEDVFAEKVAERTALTRSLGALASAVLLLQTTHGLDAHLADLIGRLGVPTVSDVDQHGQTHAVWLVGAGADQERLLALAGAGDLVVADGNHRTLAAQQSGLRRFLAVVTTPGAVTIQPYHRLLRRLDHPVPAVLDAIRAGGGAVRTLEGPLLVPAAAGEITLYAGGVAHAVRLPVGRGPAVDRLDHAVVERVLLGEVLGLDPGDKAVSYVGGDYPASWLAAEVDAGRAAAAVLIAPVTVDDFVAVNLARSKMPRKSTWFTPKVRAGLVLADVSADLSAALSDLTVRS